MPKRKKKSQREVLPPSSTWRPDSSAWREAGALALLAIVTIVAYWPAMHGEPLWDDVGHMTRPDLRSASGLYRIWFELGATQQYYPLLHTTFWLEHQLWGDDTFGYHLVNVLQHIAAAVLVYLILRRLAIPGALLAAAIFALHPVHVESVAWITEQKNTLSAVFYLGAMLAYLGFDESRSRRQYAASLVMFVLGLLNKTVTATLPAALLVIFWWQRGTLSWRRDVVPLIPFFVLGAVAGLFTAWVERTLIGAEGADFELSILERGLLAGRVVWFYLGKLLWPANLTFIYPRWHVDPAAWWQWLFPIATVTVLGILWSIRGRTRAPLAGALLFAGTLFPVLGFLNVFPFVYSFVADHFQYLASLAVIVLVAAAAAMGIARLRSPWQLIAKFGCVAVLGVLAVLTWRQCHMYRDLVTLYETTIERNPDCWMAYNNLGFIWYERNEPQKAIELYRQALVIKPDYEEAYSNWGIQLKAMGQNEEALKHFQEALRLRPDHDGTHNNIGVALIDAGRIPEAIVHFERSVSLNSRSSAAQVNLADALRQVGRTDEAKYHFTEALRLNPRDAETHANYALLLDSLGDSQNALEHFRRAVELEPQNADSHFRLGNVLSSSGRFPEAIGHFEIAVRLNPNFGDAQQNLGNALFRAGRAEEAIAHYREAARLNADNPRILVSLVLAYAASGRGEEAQSTARHALRMARAAGDSKMVADLESWLAKQAAEPARSGDELRP